MDVLRTDHCCKQRRMVRADTESCVTDSMCCATVRDVAERSVTAMRTICLWCTGVDAIDHVGPSYPPASNGHISATQLFGFVQHDYRFP
ncbi:hypothetical protein TNCV_2882551 [Trichonephila clavipes]|nr:hypothetical protein TNCV_2882551 [Trichonephila clavipes]